MEWHDIRDPLDPELDRLATQYKLHPLHIEDCRHRNQNAKIEEGQGYLFVVLKPVDFDPEGCIDLKDLDVFVGRDYIITVEEIACSSVRAVIDRVKSTSEGQRPDHVFYRILDGIVDAYTPVTDRFSKDIEDLEEKVLENPEPRLLQKLFDTRRSMIELRRVLGNTREVCGHLQRLRTGLISIELAPFLRDVYDHVVRALDNLDIQRELLAGAVEIYMSSVANRTNNVMKALTVLGTIALPALVISSFYGMNLKYLPIVDSPHATAAVALMMAGSTAFLLWILRRFGWF